MTENVEPTLNIVINRKGVKLVQFVGEGWKDEDETMSIYHRIKRLIQELDEGIRGEKCDSFFGLGDKD